MPPAKAVGTFVRDAGGSHCEASLVSRGNPEDSATDEIATAREARFAMTEREPYYHAV